MRKAIVVWGGWDGHEPELGSHLVAEMLEREDFIVERTADLDIFASPSIAAADLIVPIVTGENMPRQAAMNLRDAVRSGVGLGGYHACLATSFKESAPFRHLAGVTWVAHPGNIIDFRVRIKKPDDPILHGMSDFDYRSEQYYLHFDPTIEVLADTTFTGQYDPACAGAVMPVVFKRLFGSGRVFYSALGHAASEFKEPHMREILRRGLLWAARDRRVTR